LNIVPTILEKTNNKEYAYDLYSRLLKDRIIILNGEINDNLSSLVISELLYLDSLNHEEISLYINSPGGSVTSGLAIYDTMNYIKSDVKTIGMGMCASMAAFLLSCGTKGKRCSLENTEIMIHQPLGGAEGQASDIAIVAKRILKLKDKINKILSEKTGQKLKKITIDTDRDNYFDPEEAKNYGLIDNIITGCHPFE
jgi:ATP-dependent Clp protease protease subunit